MEKRRLSISNILMFSFIIVISLFQVSIMHNSKLDSDILWHYKLGEEIIKQHTITLNNNFTFLEGTEWIPQEWLYETLLYGVISITGLIGFFGICFINSVIMWVVTSRNKNNLILFSIVSTILIYTTPRNVGNRPSEFSIYFLIIIIYLYNKDMNNIKKLIYLLLGILVANFHGGVILVLIAIWFIMITNDIFNDWHNREKIDIKYYANKLLEILIFLGATLINPSGIKLLSTIVKVPNLDTTKYITEWRPAEVNYLLGVLLLAIVISFGYYIGKYGVKRKELQLILINVALLILSLHSRKAFILFDITWMMYGYKYLEIMLHDIFSEEVNRHIKLNKFLKATIPAGILIIAVISIETISIKESNFDTYVNSFRNEEIINKLKYDYTDGTKILANYSSGNYLIYNNMQCFVDSRQWPYAKELGNCEALDELIYVINNLQDREYIGDFIDKYTFDYIWTDSLLDLNSYLEDTKEYELIIDNENSKEKLWKRIKISN